MRPARTCAAAAVKAATPEMPMFAPAPAAGPDAASSTAGSRMFPSTSPTRPPVSATAKHQAQKATSSSGPTRVNPDEAGRRVDFCHPPGRSSVGDIDVLVNWLALDEP